MNLLPELAQEPVQDRLAAEWGEERGAGRLLRHESQYHELKKPCAEQHEIFTVGLLLVEEILGDAVAAPRNRGDGQGQGFDETFLVHILPPLLLYQKKRGYCPDLNARGQLTPSRR